MKKLTASCLCVLFFLAPISVGAEEIVDNVEKTFDKAMEYIKKGNFVKAKKELAWAQKDIDKLHTKRLLTYLKDELAGLSGKPVTTSAVLGMLAIQREYVKGDIRVKVSLTSVGTGGLGAIGRMATMFGQGNPNVENFRVGDHSGTLETARGRLTMTIYLEAGPILKLEMRGSEDKNLLQDMRKDIPLDELNKYLKGDG